MQITFPCCAQSKCRIRSEFAINTFFTVALIPNPSSDSSFDLPVCPDPRQRFLFMTTCLQDVSSLLFFNCHFRALMPSTVPSCAWLLRALNYLWVVSIIYAILPFFAWVLFPLFPILLPIYLCRSSCFSPFYLFSSFFSYFFFFLFYFLFVFIYFTSLI